MQYQLLYEYNRTALNDNKTSPETLELTRAWDRLQTQVDTHGFTGRVVILFRKFQEIR